MSKQVFKNSDLEKTIAAASKKCFVQPPEILDMADVKFIVEKQVVLANRACLVMASPVFKAMFKYDLDEKGLCEIELPGKSLPGFAAFIEITHIQAAIEKNTVLEVLPIVHEYQCDRLLAKCERYILRNSQIASTDIETFVKLMTLSLKFDLDKVNSLCMKEITKFASTDHKHLPRSACPEIVVELLKVKVEHLLNDIKEKDKIIREQGSKIKYLEQDSQSNARSYENLVERYNLLFTYKNDIKHVYLFVIGSVALFWIQKLVRRLLGR